VIRAGWICCGCSVLSAGLDLLGLLPIKEAAILGAAWAARRGLKKVCGREALIYNGLRAVVKKV
jgi:hypothetical protein